MLTNYHTHSTFCDGKNTPEEIVLAAMEKGFTAIGFSGHGYTPFDLRYCMTDTQGYMAEIQALKGKYGKDIQIYLGIEEDMFSPADRSRFDYIIGSCHYVFKDGQYYSVDSGADFRDRCLTLFGGDVNAYAESYYSAFCGYIAKRKPDIIGHFDLISKYEEAAPSGMFESNRYFEIAEKYITEAAKSDCIFEVNTGAIARGLRSSPYPCEELLCVLKKLDAKLILSSDSHSALTLDCGFEETKKRLYDIGFRHLYALDCGEFVKVKL